MTLYDTSHAFQSCLLFLSCCQLLPTKEHKEPGCGYQLPPQGGDKRKGGRRAAIAYIMLVRILNYSIWNNTENKLDTDWSNRFWQATTNTRIIQKILRYYGRRA